MLHCFLLRSACFLVQTEEEEWGSSGRCLLTKLLSDTCVVTLSFTFQLVNCMSEDAGTGGIGHAGMLGSGHFSRDKTLTKISGILLAGGVG